MAGTTDSTTATSAPDAAVGDAPEKTRKAGERKDGEGRYSRSRSRERTSYRDRDRSRDRDRRDRRDSDRDRRSSRSDRDRRDRRSDTRDRRYEDERRSSRYERRSSRSRSPRRKRTKDKTPAFDKGAVAAALARANGAITGSFASTVPGADPSLGYGLGTVGLLANPAVSALQAALASGAPIPNGGGGSGGATAPAGAADGAADVDAKKGARDFSFLVSEDQQDAGPNLAMLGDSDASDSDSEDEPGGGGEEGEEEDGFEAGSAIDQLLWRQKAVSGMETRRAGESVQQFFQRRMAGMRMLKAEAGSSTAKQLENEVDQHLMNANTAWHWGAGDHDADVSDGEDEGAPLAIEDKSNPAPPGMLTWDPTSGEAPPPPPEGEDGPVVVFGAGGGAVVPFDAEKATRRRQVIGSEAVKASGALVPRAREDSLSNEKLAPVSSGRGFALLEKMGWKAGEGLGRQKTGATLPVAAKVKSDMGGLAAAVEKGGGYSARIMSADGPTLSDGVNDERRGLSGRAGEQKRAWFRL